MPDYIKGIVEKIVDEETLLLGVTFIGDTNRSEYNDIETIHIEKLEPPFLKNIPKEKRLSRLEKKLLGQTVYCYLLGKNKQGQYNAKVVCTGPEFRGKSNRV